MHASLPSRFIATLAFLTLVALVGFSNPANAYGTPVAESPSYYQNLYPQYLQTSAYVHPLMAGNAYGYVPVVTTQTYAPPAPPVYAYPSYPSYVPNVVNVYPTQTIATGISIPKEKPQKYKMKSTTVHVKVTNDPWDKLEKYAKKPFKAAKKFGHKFGDKAEDVWDDVDDYCDDHWFC